jgi:dihydroxyacetone kinase
MSVTVVEVKKVIEKMSNVIIENEVYFCELDSAAGDGDFGMSLSKGFREVLKSIDSIDTSSIDKFIRECSMIITEFCGGASGPIWGSAFRAAANSIRDKTELNLADIAGMFTAAVAGIQKRGGAQLGDKTLLDALIPAAEALEKAAKENKTIDEAFIDAAKAAHEGAEKTKTFVAKKGRASYLGERSINYPDAGATAIGIIFTGIVQKLADK